MSLVSVIIPCYKQAHFLKDALRGVLAQTYQDFEVLVVDDGSPDDVSSVVAEFDDPRIRYIRQANQGVSAARNRGIQESRGDYLNFLDADDWFAPTKLEEQVRILEEDKAVGFVYCDVVIVHEDGHIQDDYSVGISREILSGDIFPSLLIGGYFPPHTVLIRRTILEEIGYFDESLSGTEDYDLWLRAAGSGYKACYLDRKLAYYRVHEDSQSRDWEHMNAMHLAALRKAVRMFSDQVASSVHYVVRMAEDLHVANRWLDEQLLNWQRRVSEREETIQEQQAWIAELEQGKAWLEGQWHNWQRIAEERERIIQEQQAWIGELERGKAWLEEQWDNWQRIAEERERIIQEQQAWIGELERGKAWLEEQWRTWQAEAEQREAMLQEQEAQWETLVANLEGRVLYRILAGARLLPRLPYR